MKYGKSLKHFFDMENGLLADYFDEGFDRFLFKVFSGLFEFDKIILERSNKSGQMTSVLTFEFLKKFPLDVVIMLINLGNGLLSILFYNFSVLLETKFGRKLSILNKKMLTLMMLRLC